MADPARTPVPSPSPGRATNVRTGGTAAAQLIAAQLSRGDKRRATGDLLMSTKLVAIEMYAKDKTLGESITAAIVGVGKITLRHGGDPVAIPEEAADRLVRDHKQSLRAAKGDNAKAALENARSVWRINFLATHGTTVDEALARAQAKLKTAQAEMDETKLIADEVRELRSNEPFNNSMSQPLGRKG